MTGSTDSAPNQNFNLTRNERRSSLTQLVANPVHDAVPLIPRSSSPFAISGAIISMVGPAFSGQLCTADVNSKTASTCCKGSHATNRHTFLRRLPKDIHGPQPMKQITARCIILTRLRRSQGMCMFRDRHLAATDGLRADKSRDIADGKLDRVLYGRYYPIFPQPPSFFTRFLETELVTAATTLP